MTRIGNGAATRSTQSPPPVLMKSSSNLLAISRVACSQVSMLLGVNTRLTIRRR